MGTLRGGAVPGGVIVAVAVLLGLAPRAVVAEPRVVVPETPGEAVRVTGLSPGTLSALGALDAAGWSGTLAVRVVTDTDGEVPAMLGTHRVEGADALFLPRFPFVPGQAYRARFAWGDLSLEQPFRIEPKRVAPHGTVARTYPTGEVLPANLLRLYVYFDTPMLGGDVVACVRILDAQGEPIPNAYVGSPELWDPQRHRLTLILHPGRIKQGVEPNRTLGPVLVPGQRVTLRVDASMRTADGVPLAEPYERSFQVGEADRVSPAPGQWSLDAPHAGTREALRIGLDEPLDHALLPRYLAVIKPDGLGVDGALTVGDGERVCWFVPASPWKAGPHRLVVQPGLEDRAGNRLDMLFDRQSTPSRSERTEQELPFVIGAP